MFLSIVLVLSSQTRQTHGISTVGQGPNRSDGSDSVIYRITMA